MANIIPWTAIILFVVVLAARLPIVSACLISVSMFFAGLYFYWSAMSEVASILYLYSGLAASALFFVVKDDRRRLGLCLLVLLMVVALAIVRLNDLKWTLVVINLISLLYHLKLWKSLTATYQKWLVVAAGFLDFYFYKTLSIGFFDKDHSIEWAMLTDSNLTANEGFKLLCLIPIMTTLLRLFTPLADLFSSKESISTANRLQDVTLYLFIQSLLLTKMYALYNFYSLIGMIYFAVALIFISFVLRQSPAIRFAAIVTFATSLMLITLVDERTSYYLIFFFIAALLWNAMCNSGFALLKYKQLNFISSFLVTIGLVNLIAFADTFRMTYVLIFIVLIYLWLQDILNASMKRESYAKL